MQHNLPFSSNELEHTDHFEIEQTHTSVAK